MRERLNSLFYTLLEAQGAIRNFTGPPYLALGLMVCKIKE